MCDKEHRKQLNLSKSSISSSQKLTIHLYVLSVKIKFSGTMILTQLPPQPHLLLSTCMLPSSHTALHSGYSGHTRYISTIWPLLWLFPYPGMLSGRYPCGSYLYLLYIFAQEPMEQNPPRLLSVKLPPLNLQHTPAILHYFLFHSCYYFLLLFIM